MHDCGLCVAVENIPCNVQCKKERAWFPKPKRQRGDHGKGRCVAVIVTCSFWLVLCGLLQERSTDRIQYEEFKTRTYRSYPGYDVTVQGYVCSASSYNSIDRTSLTGIETLESRRVSLRSVDRVESTIVSCLSSSILVSCAFEMTTWWTNFVQLLKTFENPAPLITTN